MKNGQDAALITGASRGIGLAIAKQLGLDGFRVGIVSTSPEEHYPEASRVLREAGVDYHWFSGDISDSVSRKALVDAAVDFYGELRVLVNNAGIAPSQRADLLDMSEESYDRVTGVNTKGTMFFTQLVARHMVGLPLGERAKRGTIVNISSCSADVVSLNRGEYCVSKAGISMLTKLYARRLAPEAILVHEVRPGIIATDMTKAVHEKYDHLIKGGTFPIARWGTAQDVANAVSLLCGNKLLYSTGTCIDVDGGFHLPVL